MRYIYKNTGHPFIFHRNPFGPCMDCTIATSLKKYPYKGQAVTVRLAKDTTAL